MPGISIDVNVQAQRNDGSCSNSGLNCDGGLDCNDDLISVPSTLRTDISSRFVLRVIRKHAPLSGIVRVSNSHS
jgi:hypothetical protein